MRVFGYRFGKNDKNRHKKLKHFQVEIAKAKKSQSGHMHGREQGHLSIKA